MAAVISESKASQHPAKHWGFTLNNPEDVKRPQQWSELCQYAVWQLEEGDSKTPHIQGYICLLKKKRLRYLKANLSQRAYWFACDGTPHENYVYCTKEKGRLAGPFAYGEFPTTGGQAEKKRWESARELARSQGDLYDLPADIHLRYKRTLESMARESAPKASALSFLQNEWHYGGAGTGKSSYCWNKYAVHLDDCYLKDMTKWWDGYKGQNTAFIDEFDDKNMYFLTQVKKWAGNPPFSAQSKGSVAVIRPRRIVITSNLTIDQVCTDKEGKYLHVQFGEPMHRRFQEYDWDVVESKVSLCRPPDWWFYSNAADACAVRAQRGIQVPWETKEAPAINHQAPWLEWKNAAPVAPPEAINDGEIEYDEDALSSSDESDATVVLADYETLDHFMEECSAREELWALMKRGQHVDEGENKE